MLDYNNFKKKIKEWMNLYPEGTIDDLIDYCEELIPSHQYSSYSWLIEQTAEWYKYILTQRKFIEEQLDDEQY